MENIEKIFNQLRTLAQYKDSPDAELWKKAAEKAELLSKDDDELEVEEMFIDKAEKKEARGLLRRYLKNYTFDNISEKNTVKQLVFLEVFNGRLQNELNLYHKEGQPSSPKTIEALHSNLNQISILKAQLGIRKDKEKSASDAFMIFETLKKKAAKWREENSGSRTRNCPYCGKMVMWRVRMDAWDVVKHPFFVDRFLANKHLMMMYKEDRIKKSDVAKILETSEDYVDCLLERVFPKAYRKQEPTPVEAEVKEESNNGK
jgi:hypothetical protein